MKQDDYWKKFESSGQIEHYMQFKQAVPHADTQAAMTKESTDANDNHGLGASCNQNG